MIRHALFFICLLLCHRVGQAETLIETFGSDDNQFAMKFVPIGDPGNAVDVMFEQREIAGRVIQLANYTHGKVDYPYRMGKFEVSGDMIRKANALGKLELTVRSRGPDKPATDVSWNEAARFVNWLNTSQGFHAAYRFPTSPGDSGYVANQDIQLWSKEKSWQVGGENRFRHKDAHYFLPSEDEWYKAAYYDPEHSQYFDFPSGSDTEPTAVASGTAAGTAVFKSQSGPADVTQAGGSSPCGTVGQGGNVTEWLESSWDVNNDGSTWRGIRGGHWFAGSDRFHVRENAVGRNLHPTKEVGTLGFRVACVHERSPKE